MQETQDTSDTRNGCVEGQHPVLKRFLVLMLVLLSRARPHGAPSTADVHWEEESLHIHLLSSTLNSSAVIDLENMPNVPLVAASWPSWLVAAMQSVMVITLKPFS